MKCVVRAVKYVMIALMLPFRAVYYLFHKHCTRKNGAKSLFDKQIAAHAIKNLDEYDECKDRCMNLMEMDVTFSKNGVPVLAHDDEQQIGGRTVKLSSIIFPLKNRGSYDLPCTLESILIRCREDDFCLWIDVKNPSFYMLKNLVRMLKKYKVYDRCVLDLPGFSGLFFSVFVDSRIGLGFPMRNMLWLRFLHFLRANSLTYVSISYSVSSPAVESKRMAYAREQGMVCSAFTINDKETADKWLKVGCDIILSDTLDNYLVM